MRPHSPNTSRIDAAITHLVNEYNAETVFTRAKLIKFLYLADKAYLKNNRSTITGVAWTKYHYGPYADIIVQRLKAIDGESIDIKLQVVHGTTTQFHHRPLEHDTEGKPALTDEMRDCLDIVLEEHASRDTTNLVETICNSKAVAETEKYGIIDLTA